MMLYIYIQYVLYYNCIWPHRTEKYNLTYNFIYLLDTAINSSKTMNYLFDIFKFIIPF